MMTTTKRTVKAMLSANPTPIDDSAAPWTDTEGVELEMAVEPTEGATAAVLPSPLPPVDFELLRLRALKPRDAHSIQQLERASTA